MISICDDYHKRGFLDEMAKFITSSSRKVVCHGVGASSSGGRQTTPPIHKFYTSLERIGFVNYCYFMVIKTHFILNLLFCIFFLFPVLKRYEPGVDMSTGP